MAEVKQTVLIAFRVVVAVDVERARWSAMHDFDDCDPDDVVGLVHDEIVSNLEDRKWTTAVMVSPEKPTADDLEAFDELEA